MEMIYFPIKLDPNLPADSDQNTYILLKIAVNGIIETVWHKIDATLCSEAQICTDGIPCSDLILCGNETIATRLLVKNTNLNL